MALLKIETPYPDMYIKFTSDRLLLQTSMWGVYFKYDSYELDGSYWDRSLLADDIKREEIIHTLQQWCLTNPLLSALSIKLQQVDKLQQEIKDIKKQLGV